MDYICILSPLSSLLSLLLTAKWSGGPIGEFAPGALGPLGVVHDATPAGTDEGRRARDSMHNRIVADAFIPAGGRPSTLNAGNWEQFLLADGVTPSAPLIVEGANLFVTADARAALFARAGVRIVKDSSANKCGVICSSFEIASSMLLDEDEFTRVKPAVVADVLVRLRGLAKQEARALVAGYSVIRFVVYSDSTPPNLVIVARWVACRGWSY